MIETTAEPVPQVDGATFRALIAQVAPRAEETRWLDIPWETTLWQGRRLAADAGKPIFLWAMNGNPLGCT